MTTVVHTYGIANSGFAPTESAGNLWNLYIIDSAFKLHTMVPEAVVTATHSHRPRPGPWPGQPAAEPRR